MRGPAEFDHAARGPSRNGPTRYAADGRRPGVPVTASRQLTDERVQTVRGPVLHVERFHSSFDAGLLTGAPSMLTDRLSTGVVNLEAGLQGRAVFRPALQSGTAGSQVQGRFGVVVAANWPPIGIPLGWRAGVIGHALHVWGKL